MHSPVLIEFVVEISVAPDATSRECPRPAVRCTRARDGDAGVSNAKSRARRSPCAMR